MDGFQRYRVSPINYAKLITRNCGKFWAMITSANRPSVKYFNSDDLPTVESPISISLEVSET